MRKYLSIVTIVLLISNFTNCKNEESTPINILLYDKPLSTIQRYIQGKWKLQYAQGGFAGLKYVDTINSYMILNSEHIVLGNDTKGVYVDAPVVWARTQIGTDFTYLLKYDYADPIIIAEIKNDTLLIRQYLDDGLSYYYTKY